MKSSVKILRVLLLMLLLVVSYSNAAALSINNHFNSESFNFNKEYGFIDHLGQAEYDTTGTKNATPNIELTLIPFGAEIAQLSWTSTDFTIPGTYYVQRLDPSGWTVLMQLPYNAVREYNDTISYPYCTLTSISYLISFVSSIDSTTSAPKSAFLFDQNSPADVKDLNVDLMFTPSGVLPRVTWDRNITDSISRYDIQRYDNISTNWPVIGSVPADSSGFTDLTANLPCENSYRYVVLAYDMCGNHSGGQLYDDIAVHTIVIDVAQFQPCEKSANLTWNSNVHMPGGISGFRIYRSDGGPAVEIDTVAPSVLTYVDNFNFINGTSYGYSVTAYSNNSSYTSSSCQGFEQYTGAIEPDTVYITQVTVVNNVDIQVGCYFSPGSSVAQLILERSDDNGTNFHAIDSLVVAGPANPYFFNDTTVDVQAQSYSYRLITVDDCGNRKASMNDSRSIYLLCSPSSAQNSLDWNSYESWMQYVEGYDVYRILDGQSASIELLGTVGQTIVSYQDLLSGFDQVKLPCYWVVAKENTGNPVYHNATSTSNTCCVLKNPVIYMPNAFSPDGENKFFRPVPTPLYVDAQSFKMTIFSRWGQQIFETTDMVNGWDGTVNGQYTPTGLYSYILTYSSLQGKEYTKRGTVTLIR